jgi:hypothetical protein
LKVEAVLAGGGAALIVEGIKANGTVTSFRGHLELHEPDPLAVQHDQMPGFGH